MTFRKPEAGSVKGEWGEPIVSVEYDWSKPKAAVWEVVWAAKPVHIPFLSMGELAKQHVIPAPRKSWWKRLLEAWGGTR